MLIKPAPIFWISSINIKLSPIIFCEILFAYHRLLGLSPKRPFPSLLPKNAPSFFRSDNNKLSLPWPQFHGPWNYRQTILSADSRKILLPLWTAAGQLHPVSHFSWLGDLGNLYENTSTDPVNSAPTTSPRLVILWYLPGVICGARRVDNGPLNLETI